MTAITQMSDEQFVEYLERLAQQHYDASRSYQAETLREAAHRIKRSKSMTQVNHEKSQIP